MLKYKDLWIGILCCIEDIHGKLLYGIYSIEYQVKLTL